MLKPRLQADVAQSHGERHTPSVQTGNDQVRLDNMFALLTVDEPSEEFFIAPDIAPTLLKVGSADVRYGVEPFEDLFELYLRTAALLQDLSKIRRAVKNV